MIIIHTKNEIKSIQLQLLKENKSIGFVPTMGALHKGHLSLIKKSKNENDVTFCSVYVNPTQFNDAKDFNRYPRTVEVDSKLLEEAGCDYLFLPSDQEMYPQKSIINFSFGELEHVMEGKFRPGHFNGVATVVGKFFNILKPTRAYFGQKDLQQTVVIKKLVESLSFDVELVICDTLREEDGLAMSSRNTLLKPEHRPLATVLYKALTHAKELYLKGEPVKQIIEKATSEIKSNHNFRLEYFEIADMDTLKSVELNTKSVPVAICVACFLGEIRLIDNLVIN